ncbi:MAG: serine protease [Myxococcota bacterium]
MSRSSPSRRGLSLGVALAGASVLPLSPVHAGAPTGPDLAALYRRHAPAIVYIRAKYEADGAPQVNSGAGAVLVGGRILTACHVLRYGPDDAAEVDAVEVIEGQRDPATGAVRAGRRVAAKIIRCDRERDLAILAVTDEASDVAGLRIARRHARVGQEVAALGHSWRGFPWTVHGCAIAGRGHPIHDGTARLSAPVESLSTEALRQRPKKEPTMLEVDCDSHPLSGSVLLDAGGAIVGVHQFSQFDPSQTQRDEYSHYVDATEIRRFMAE